MGTGSVVAFLAGALCMQVDFGEPRQLRHAITVTGTATVESEPDVAYVTVYLSAEGALLADAVEEATAKVEKVKDAVSQQHKLIRKFELAGVWIGDSGGVAGADDKNVLPRPRVVQRLRMSIQPSPRLAHEIVDTAIQSGALLRAPSAVDLPAEPMGVVVYGLEDASRARDRARKEALADARKNALETARLTKRRIGRIGDIVSVARGSAPPCPRHRCPRGCGARFPAEHISTDPERVELSHTVTVTYELSGD